MFYTQEEPEENFMNFSKYTNRKKIKRINSTGIKATKLAGTSFIRLIVFSIILIAVIGVTAVLGIVNGIFDSAPTLNFEDLVPEGYTSFIYDQNGVLLQELSTGDANRIYVEIDLIPKHVKDAFVAIEDERFYEHNGIDMRGIFRAIFVNLKSGQFSEGASTITQQVIKNNILSTEKNFKRKIQEQYLAVQAEKTLSKDDILELYLNTVGLGRGTNGVQAAANRYFNKDIGELSIAEAAVIASITQRPTAYDPVTNPENNRERQEIVLQYMLDQGKISKAQYALAINEKVYEHIQVANQAFEAQSDYSYFVDETIRRVATDLKEQKGYSSNQAINLIYRGGLSIYVTQDRAMQKILDDAFVREETFPTFKDDYNVTLMYTASIKKGEEIQQHYEEIILQSDEEALAYIETLKAEWLVDGGEIIAENSLFIPQPQAAMVVMDYYTGHVKAMIGGRGEKIGNQTLNRATQSTRQPGSTFKILAAYLPALDSMGFTLATVYDDAPYTLNLPNGTNYSPKNWYSHSKYNFWGLSTLREGIQWSMNLLAIKTTFDVGIDTCFNYLMDLGFTTLVDREEIGGQVFTDKNPVLPLGGLTHGVSLLELTSAYSAIANNGVYIEPSFYTKVLSHDGSILLLKTPETHTVMKKTTAFLLTNAMEGVVSSGTGTPAKFSGMHIAGKTGTTSDTKDLAFIGYTPYYIAGVWLGHDEPEEMKHNKPYHKYLWRDVMAQIHEGLENRSFPVPEGIVRATICTESGLLPVPGLCDHDPRGPTTRYEYFAQGTVPTKTCDVHVKVKVCEASGLFPTEYCPEETIVEKVFTSRVEPLVPESWDPNKPPRIKDYEYELPPTVAYEFCNIHTDHPVDPEVQLDADGNPITPTTETTEIPIPPVDISNE